MSNHDPHKISELYRKYIIKFKYSPNRFCYTMWGTDLSSDDDFFLLDAQKKIVAFKQIKGLVDFVRQTEIELIDKKNTLEWALSNKIKRSYATYNFTSLIDILDSDKSIFEYDKQQAFCVIDVYNLIEDYANQTNDTELSKLIHSKNSRMIIEWFHAIFFWSKDEGRISKLEKRLQKFDFSFF